MTDLITIFYEIDNFCKDFEAQFNNHLLSNGKNIRKRRIKMVLSEIMTISIWYHSSGYHTFKDYYEKHVICYMNKDFPNLVSYTRFIELRKLIVMPMLVFLATKKLSTSTEVAFIDSFKLEACHIKRASSHKTLQNIAKKGKTSTGWFYGMKVHIIINHKGEIISFYISPGNIADNNEKVLFKLTKKVFGKLFGDKGYLVNKEIFKKLYKNGIHLITKVRDNMKNKLMEITDKLLLKKRGVVESTGDILKNHLYMDHTRHRSIWGFFLHIFTSIAAYQMRDKKPSIVPKFATELLNA